MSKLKSVLSKNNAGGVHTPSLTAGQGLLVEPTKGLSLQ